MESIIMHGSRMIEEAQKILVFSGAGMSTESGISDFRSPGGVWSKYDPSDFYFDKIISSEETRRKYWQMSTEFYHAMKDALPNRAHMAVKRLEEKKKLLAIVTQNIDNLHQKAGSINVIEMHGNLFRQRCLACEAKKPFGREEYLGSVKTAIAEITTFDLPSIIEMLPKCDCGSPMRPDVVMFGEAVQGLYESFQEADDCDAMLVLGTSGVVYPAAALPQKAKEAGATVIEINPGDSAYFGVADIRLQGKTGEILPRIVQKIQNA